MGGKREREKEILTSFLFLSETLTETTEFVRRVKVGRERERKMDR